MAKVCPRCNQQNPDDAAFCRNCSAPLGGQGPVIGGQPNQQWGQQQNFNAPTTGGGASTRATVSLIMAAAALFCCGPFLGIPAAIVAWMELDSIKKGLSSPAGKWMAQVGLWVGIIASVLQIGIWIVMMMLSALSNPYGY